VTADDDGHTVEFDAPRRMTDEEAQAVLTLVRGGWLRLTLDLSDSLPATVNPPDRGAWLEAVCGDYPAPCNHDPAHVYPPG
jgi:hypothetical protein